MNEIQAEGTTYLYFTKKEGLPSSSILGATVIGIPDQMIWDTLLKTSMNDMRVVLSKLLEPNTLYLYFLHWDDSANLDILDEQVLNGTFSDADFVNSVKTQLTRTKCLNCDWQGDTLVMPPAEPYIGSPGLERKKLSVRYERHGFKTCPNCGAKLRQDVVKIFKNV